MRAVGRDRGGGGPALGNVNPADEPIADVSTVCPPTVAYTTQWMMCSLPSLTKSACKSRTPSYYILWV